MFRKIVVPVDLEDASSWRQALPVAIDYVRNASAELHVLTVVPDEMLRMTIVAQLIPAGYEENLIADTQDRLCKLLLAKIPDGVAVRQAVRCGSVYREVMRYVRDVGADLIIMGAKKPNIAGYLLGSNADQVLRHADCSVWTVRG